MNSTLEDYFGETVYSYTRAQAIADGVLVDVTATAKEYGFKIPVAMTSAVWQDCISWDNNIQAMHQDESGRLADILWMCFIAIHKSKNNQCLFKVYRIRKDETNPTLVQLKCIIGGGDNSEPVITIMQPQED